ncbi:MAG: penicillin-binding protein 2 [Proteobacteria bacterium]|nr:penicillin-binding protein 2 [Pseudomonadota bacterium]
MATTLSRRDEARVYESRYKFLYFAVIFFLVVMVSRLWYLQLYNGKLFRAYAEKNRIWQEKDYAPRGMVFDRNGKLLVDNKLAFDVIVRSQYLPDDETEYEDVIKKLSGFLKISVDDVKSKIAKANDLPLFYPVVIAQDVDRDKVALVESNKVFMPGVDVIVRNKRTYLYGESTAHVIGYIGEVNKSEINKLSTTYDMSNRKLYTGDYIGKFGLEKVWDLELRGYDGAKYVIVDANGRMKSEDESKALFGSLPSAKSEPGRNIILTIDNDLQQIAYKYFKDGNKKGAAIALDPRSGEVLVMVSAPSFDPTVFSGGVTPELLKEVQNSPYRPFYNKTIQDHYSPGSTFKPFVALAALEEGIVDENFKTTCLGRLFFGNRYFHCYKKQGHGTIDFHNGLVRSCDVVFYKLGMKLGVDNIYKYTYQLGLSQKTGIDLPEERPGLIPSSEWKMKRFGIKWMPGEDLSMAIGQGYDLVTPIQLANAYGGIATGVVYRPHVLKRIEDVNGTVIYEPKSEIRHTLDIKPKIRDFLLKALWGVVNEGSGTAWWYRLEGLDMAGKTGTVQLYGITEQDIYKKCENLEETKRHHGWFVGFAPYDKPEIVVAVIAEHSCHGSSGAAPLVRDLVKAYYAKYKFERDKNKPVDEVKSKTENASEKPVGKKEDQEE